MSQFEPGASSSASDVGLDHDIDVERPSPARIYDYWLGGFHNFAADRDLGRRMAEAIPTGPPAMWANRGFLRRVVKHLVTEAGIRQFLDLGSGIPTVGNVHQVAQTYEPEAKVVYVDIDPVAVAHARQLLVGNENATILRADLRDPDAVLGDPRVGRLLDLSQPIAVLMIFVLHFLPDDQDPAGIAARYLAAAAPGSYLAISHAGHAPRQADVQREVLADYVRATGMPALPRGQEQIAALFGAMEIEPPGVVLVNEWRPEGPADDRPMLPSFGGLARKSDA